MSLLIIPKSAATLSEIEIDVDKDWQGYGITNLKELVRDMHKGDVLVHDGTRIAKLSPTNIGDELTSGGAGQPTNFQAPPVLEE